MESVEMISCWHISGINMSIRGGYDSFEIDCMIPFKYNRTRIANADNVDIFETADRYKTGRIEAVIICKYFGSQSELKKLVRQFKFNGIEKIGVLFAFMDRANFSWLDSEKFFLPYLEVNAIDGCNLNCKGCSHFSPLFGIDEVYQLENLKRDMRHLSRHCDVSTIRIVGGEPFLLKNLDEYLRTIKKYFPQSLIRVLSNGLLIPTVPRKVFEYISQEKISIEISEYPPTTKIKSKLVDIFKTHDIPFLFSEPVQTFRTLLRLEPGLSNPETAMRVCPCSFSRYIRDGRLYKCPIDALHPRFNEKFPNAMKLPKNAASIDIFDPNFTELIDLLDEPVEMCGYCPEKPTQFDWTIDHNPSADNWRV